MILITGWTGNTGSLVIQQIRRRFPELNIVGVARSAGDSTCDYVIAERADLTDDAALEALFRKYRFEMVIHIANIRYSPLMMRLAETHAVPHIVLVHTTGIYSKYQQYSRLYQEIERSILEADWKRTKWTILRPTLIYGNQRDHNMHRLIRFLARCPIFPVFGDGSALMQPIHVEDLATAIVCSIRNPKALNRAYDLSGGSVVTYKDILQTIGGLLGRRIHYVHIPLRLAIVLVALYGRFVRDPRVTVEQVERLQENKSYPHEAAAADLDYRPRPFHEGIAQEVTELRREGLI